MIRFFSLFVTIICMFSMPVLAQENADDVLAEQGMVSENEPIKPIEAEENYEERLELSRKMHEIWPIRPKVESALEQISEQIEPQERLSFKAGMRKAIEFDALEEGSIDAMADLFSAKELEAMIAFYGSKEGRSVSHKTGDYEKALIPLVTKMIDKALLYVKLGPE